ncbi:MAG: CoA-binding protein [Woeseiaceae bacterium]|jgi:predicted CoA-binding protein|nr:CoA-binding protein [Woeseiaceae bacterium]
MDKQADGLGDNDILKILDDTRRIAVIGLSSNPGRASYGVTRYLVGAGFLVSGVNPALAGEEVAGAPVFASLADVPGPVDMVDVFRRVDALAAVTSEVIDLAGEKRIRYLWLQLGLVHRDAAAQAEAAGLTVVMDRCLKIEHARLTPT